MKTMSAYLYDDAIVDDLRKVIGDDRIHLTVVERAMEVIPRINEDKFTLPLVTLSRTGWRILSNNHNHSARFEGGIVDIHPHNDTTRIKRVQFIPMQLDYNIDVWTRTRRENDEIVRELFWYFLIAPTLTIRVPYDLEFDHNFNLFIEPDIEDNSDISGQPAHGEYFRQTLHIYTDDAKLWKSTSRGPTHVTIKGELITDKPQRPPKPVIQ